MTTRKTFFVTHETGVYFRVYGYGLAVEKDLYRSFSERNGYRRIYRLGRWSLEVLKPERRRRED